MATPTITVHLYETGLTAYGKPLPHTSTWSDGVVTFSPDSNDGREYVSDSGLDDTLEWRIYEQAGGSPANTDEVVAIVPKALAADWEDGGRLDLLLDKVASGTANRVGPDFDPDTSTFTLQQGDDYLEENDRHVDFDIGFTESIDGWSVEVGAYSKHLGSIKGIGSLVDNGSGHSIRVEWPKEELKCPGDEYVWSARLKDPDGNLQTEIKGPLILQVSGIQ